MSPVISIIMPTYNGESYMYQAIDSVLSQSFLNWELLIFDDQSTDGTQKIVEEYMKKHDNIHLLSSTKKEYIAGGRNIAIQNAKGKYICLLDHDDTWINQYKLQLQFDYMEQNEQVGICGTSYIIIDGDNREIGKKQIQGNNDSIKKNILLYSPFLVSSVIIRSELLQKYGFFDPDFDKVEDYELWLRIGQYTEFYNMGEYCVGYRLHASNTSIQLRNVLIMKYYELLLIWKYRKTYAFNFRSLILKIGILFVPYKLLLRNPGVVEYIKRVLVINK